MKCGKRARAAIECLELRRLLSVVPAPDHIVIVVEENQEFNDIIGNPDAAFINSLAAGGASFSNYSGITHPSQPNYLALFSGGTQGVTEDDIPTTALSGPDLSSELTAAGKSFTGYSEGLPYAGSLVENYGDYARKHNAWSDFSDVPETANQPFAAFPLNFDALPTVSFVVPDLEHDMHDGTIADGDQWLQANLGPYADWAKTHNSLLVVTWDENEYDDTVNRIPTIFSGQSVQPGAYSEQVSHYSLLRTIEDMYGLPYLGASALALPITDVWTGASNPTPADDQITFLSNLTPLSATIGYGTIQKNSSIKGNPIKLRGTTYSSGIGTHAVSQMVYGLVGQYSSFSADVGVDDEVTDANGLGSVDFQVVGDGVTLYDSGVLTNNSPVAHINVSVAGVQQLTLIASNGVADNIDFDHADWAGAQFSRPAPAQAAPSAPINFSAAAASSSLINLSWTNTANNQSSFEIDRSTDGTTFAPVVRTGASVSTYTDARLTPDTRYYYRVLATNSFGSSPASNIANAVTLAANTIQVFLSDQNWVSATSGFGAVHKDTSINGNTIKLRGTTYTKGIGTHAVSNIVYTLAGRYTAFQSDIGVDDEVTGQGSVDFKVLGDGNVLFDSGSLTGSSPVGHINVSVAGVQQLTLMASNGVSGNIDYDHADWAGAQLIGAPASPTAPANLAAVAISMSKIDLTWTNTATNQSGIEVDRSTNGTVFTLLKNLDPTATSYSDTALAAGSTYYYRVEAINSIGPSPVSNIANAATFTSNPVTTDLSSLTWASATIGYGTVRKDASVSGNLLTLGGVTYPKGIGTHAASQIVYNLGGKYTTFLSDVGVDDEVADHGAVDFQVIGDGKVLFDSGVLTGNSATFSVNVSVVGVQTLTLIATNGVLDIDFDHADWAGASLLGLPAVPAAPGNLVATPISSSQINLNWSIPAGSPTGYQIDRSADGVTYALRANVGSGVSTFADTPLTASTTYYYRVEAINAVGMSPSSNLATTATLPATSTTTYLSDLNWTAATTGYMTVQKNASVKGNPITLRGATSAKGIGTHADSTITYNLAGAYSTFQSDIGIDDEVNGQGSVHFQVIGDGRVLFDSGTLTGASAVAQVSVSVAGVQTLQLVVSSTTPGVIDFDHADWANALLRT